MEEIIQKVIDTFNEKSEKDEKVKKKIGKLERNIVIEISDEKTYHMTLKDGHLSEFGVGDVDSDIRIMSDSVTLTKIINKEMSAVKAYATKKLKMKAAFSDLMMIKSLF